MTRNVSEDRRYKKWREGTACHTPVHRPHASRCVVSKLLGYIYCTYGETPLPAVHCASPNRGEPHARPWSNDLTLRTMWMLDG